MQFPCADADKLKDLLELSEREFTKKQLEAAMSRGDHARAVRVADKLGEIKFRDSSYRSSRVEKCPLLKSPERFCKRLCLLLRVLFQKYASLGPESDSHYTLRWSSIPIFMIPSRPRSYNVMLVMHKSISCAMGDRRYNNFSAIISELLTQGLSHQVIADEIFTQFAKQLTPASPDYGKAGPSPQASALGWEVLGLCFKTFRPSPRWHPFLKYGFENNVPRPKMQFSFDASSSLEETCAPPTVESVERALSRIRASTKNTSKRWRMSGVHMNFDIDMALEDVDLDPVAIPT